MPTTEAAHRRLSRRARLRAWPSKLRDDAADWAPCYPRATASFSMSAAAPRDAEASSAAATLTRPRRGYHLILAGRAAIRRRARLRRRGRAAPRQPERSHVSWRGPTVKPSYTYEKDAQRSIAAPSLSSAARPTLSASRRSKSGSPCGSSSLRHGRAARDLAFSRGAAEAGRERFARARRSSATRAWSPRGSPARGCLRTTKSFCTLSDPHAGLAGELGTTRTAAAMELWLPRLAGAVVAIGNAPTALFRLLSSLPRARPVRPRDRHAGRLCWRGGIERGADRERPAGHSRARAQGRQRDGRGGRERAGERNE